LRVRTGYSFRTAVGHLPDVMARVKEIGWDVAPISDRMSTFGFTRWTKLCEKEGLRPIYGVEIPCVAALGEKKPTTDNWTFFALDSLRPLHELIYKATNNPGKEPTLLYTQAMAQEGVIIVSGERLLVDKLPAAVHDRFYVGLSPSTPRGLLRRAINYDLKFLATSDNYYPNAADKEFYRVTLGWRGGTQTYPMSILSDDELNAEFELAGVPGSIIDSAFANRDAAMAACRATMKKAQLLVPEKPQTLREMCERGAVERGIDLNDPVYAERLDRELRLINEKNFEDYFYILSDIVGWAKDHMVVGPARGSSCGSLACYLLNITAIDPIPYGLIFERFIDINRMDLPDIDIDFSDVRRNLVFDYAESRFGRERVARLGTVGMFKARSALNQTGLALQIPKWRIDKLADSIIERSSGDSRVMNSLEDTLNDTDAGRSIVRENPEIMIATRMEGHPQVSSQHAAGLLLTAEPIVEYVAMDARTRAAWCDKKDAETLNLLKIDALGLTQLSIFERTLELIGRKPVSGWLETLPLDDPAAFEVLNKGMYSGVFQITGTAIRSLAGQIKFESLDDLIAMGAIVRPGPLASGGTAAWIKRRNGEAVPANVHPLLAELTKDTYGVVIYQETVMRITRELGQFSWAETSAIRKLMSSRMGDEAFSHWEAKFIEGATANGMPEPEARAVWDQINSFGSWAFNKSHSVAYGIISYWCCWLKAHFPLEFAAATLDAESEPGKQLAMLRELDAEGIKYIPVDPEHSVERWAVADRDGKKILVGPLTAIKGIGPAKVRQILDARKAGEELKPGLAKQLANARTEVDSLEPIKDRIAALYPDLTTINIFSEPRRVIDVQPGVRGEVMIIAKAVRISPRDDNDAQNVAKRNGRRLAGQTQTLNMFFADDTDEVFCKVDRFNFERLGRKILEQGRAGRSIYAIKGTVPHDFRMIKVSQVRYLGEM
jgi:DNA-directed DNA polymerase III PolC